MKQRKSFLCQLNSIFLFTALLTIIACGSSGSGGTGASGSTGADNDSNGNNDELSHVENPCIVGVDCTSSTPPTQEWRVKDIELGDDYSCVIFENGRMRCWGGLYAMSKDDPDVPVRHEGEKIIQASFSSYFRCVLIDTGTVRCWGKNKNGRLGNGQTEGEVMPEDAVDVEVLNPGESVVQVETGEEHACVVLNTGVMRCWGYGLHGQLGYKNSDTLGDDPNDDLKQDVAILKPNEKVKQISLGAYHSCALLDTGQVRCWGNHQVSQLGYGDKVEAFWGDDALDDLTMDVPITHPDEDAYVIQIDVKEHHNCVLLNTGKVRCWGDYYSGALGFIDWPKVTNEDIDPIPVKNIGGVEGPSILEVGDVLVTQGEEKVVHVVTGREHSCVLLNTGKVRCWGYNLKGKLGYDHSEFVSFVGMNYYKDLDYLEVLEAGNVPISDKGETVIALAAGGDHNCALLDTYQLRCWGSGFYRQLGYGDQENVGDGIGLSIVEAGNVPLYE